jgi:hypothetical protein
VWGGDAVDGGAGTGRGEPDPAALQRPVNGYQVTQALHVAATLKIADRLWADEPATAILRNCRRGLDRDGRLLLVEGVLAPPNEGAPGKFSDLNMLVSPGGRERTSDEFAALLAAAGFRLEAVHPTADVVAVVEAVPA